MIVQDNPTVAVSSGMGKTVEYTANMDGMMFDNMINGIYSNKIAAPIREISTNARDGHALNNCLDKPFDVALPTRMEPVFAVRDYGCSLTEDDVMNIYSVIGKSTKRDTNEATGCLGLGSKSPFAYTSAFSITCWKDGFEELYTSYKQTGGTPVISKVHKVRSNKAQGVMVSFPVKTEDIEVFNKEASKVFIGFSPRPNIIRSTQTFQWDEREPIVKTDKVEIFQRSNKYGPAEAYAISGSVAYPLKTDPALISAINNNPDTTKPTSYPYKSKEELLLERTDLRIKFNIGELTTTTSREELSYDTRTCANIAKRLVEIIKEQEIAFNVAYEKETNLFNAQKRYANDIDSGVIGTLSEILNFSTKAKYKGTDLWFKINVSNYSDDCKVWFNPDSAYRQQSNMKEKIFKFTFINLASLRGKYDFGEMKTSFSFTKAKQDTKTMNFNQLQEAKFFVLEESDTLRVNNRLRRVWKGLSSADKNILITVSKWSDWVAFKKICMIPNKNITLLKDVEELPLEKAKIVTPSGVAVAKTKIDIREIRRQRYASNASNYRTTLDLTSADKYVRIWQEGNSFYKTKSDRDAQVNRYTQEGISREYYDSGDLIKKPVIVLNKQNQKLNDNHPHLFVDMDTEIKENVAKELYKLPDLIKRSSIQNALGADNKFYQMISKVEKDNLPKFLISTPISDGKDISSLDIYELELFQKMLELFPDECTKAKKEVLEKDDVKLLDVKKIKDDHPIISSLFFAYSHSGDFSYREGYAEYKKTTITAINEYCKTLKKEGK